MSLFVKVVSTVGLLCGLTSAVSCESQHEHDMMSLVQLDRTLKFGGKRSEQEGSAAARETAQQMPIQSFGMQDLPGHTDPQMFAQADQARQRVTSIGNIPEQVWKALGPDMATGAFDNGAQFGFQDHHASQLRSGRAQNQRSMMQTAKFAQAEAGNQAKSFSQVEGTKMAHDLMLKNILDKYYTDKASPAIVAPALVMNTPATQYIVAPAAPPVALYSTGSQSALSDGLIQAAVQDALAKTSGSSQQGESSQTSQDTVLKQILSTQNLLLEKVTGKESNMQEEGKNMDGMEERVRRYEKVNNLISTGKSRDSNPNFSEEDFHPEKLNPVVTAAIDAEKHMYQAHVVADKQNWDSYNAQMKKAVADHVQNQDNLAGYLANSRNELANTLASQTDLGAWGDDAMMQGVLEAKGLGSMASVPSVPSVPNMANTGMDSTESMPNTMLQLNDDDDD